ncbi:MAG: response regulator transcription factor [Proteobacteria bacterium]|nr:response regulator transcription factor [Pseudomonadota bacterium]
MHVLLIDDHALFREGVALLLRPLQEGLTTSEAGSCEEALAQVAAGSAPDLVLMDLGLPGMSGLDGMALMRERLPAVPVVALSSSDDKATVLRALDAGAMGFIPKSASAAVFIAALRLILARGVYLPPSVFLSPAPAAPAPRTTPASLGLTERQAQVLHLILQGQSAKLIGRELDLAPGTVKAHTSAVLRALNVTTRTQAVVAAGRLGLTF